MSVIVDGSNGLIFNDASTQTTAATGFGFKNRVINGDMRIAQRGTSPTMTGGGDYSLDRFGHYYSSGAVTTAQSSVAPAGFAKSLLITVSSAASSPTYNFFYQKIEGLNCTDLGFGLSTASSVTLSFWVRSSVTGIYSVSITNYDGDRAYAVQYTINAANTWEQKTITIPGDTTGTWYTTNTVGLYVRWNMGSASGSRLISAGSWQAANADGATGSTGANAWVNTSGATFYITGVQLEKGSTATTFDFRDYGRELIMCQRYYQTTQDFTGIMNGTTSAIGMIHWSVWMRSRPTISTNGNIEITDGYTADYSQSSGGISTNYQTTNSTGAMVSIANFSGLNAYRFCFTRQSTSAMFTLSAEL